MHPFTAKMVKYQQELTKRLEKLPVQMKSIHAKRNIMKGKVYK